MSARYLLDTHVLLWWLSEPSRVSSEAAEAIANGANEVYVSSAAVWEMAIKKTLGRLEIPGNLEAVLRRDHIDVLPISAAHALAVADLPLHHQDTFDRIQIAQSRLEGLVLVTRDRKFAQYDVDLLQA